MPLTADIEAALVAHWSQFGRWPKSRLVDSDGLLRLETPIKHLPYNGIIRTRLGDTADADIATVTERFHARETPWFWFVSPNATPADLGERLFAHGLRSAARITCMSLELAEWEPPPLPQHVRCEEVLDARALQRAKHDGCHRAVLHSTQMAVAVYRQAGFVERCPMTLVAGSGSRPR